MTVIQFEDACLARLKKRAAAWGFDVLKEPAGTLALIAYALTRPETVGTLAEISASLDQLDEQAKEPHGDIPLADFLD
jgi:hypothetical protein